MKAKKLQARATEKEQKRLHVPTIDRSTGEPAPYVIVVQGPPKVGKSLLIKSLVKHYTKQNLPEVRGPITIVSGMYWLPTLFLFFFPVSLVQTWIMGSIRKQEWIHLITSEILSWLVSVSLMFQLDCDFYLLKKEVERISNMPEVLGGCGKLRK